MSAAPNITWSLPKPLMTDSNFAANYAYAPKPKLLNYRMLFVDNKLGNEDESKYFLTPVSAFQMASIDSQNLLVAKNSENVNLSSADYNATTATVQKLRPYSCLECGKTFIQKHHLTTHKKVHLGIRPHACDYCGKTFTHKHCLNTHLLLHSSERPYQCNICKKSFTLKHHLISHTKVHSREKPFVCTECGCAFPLKRHLVTHTKFHAGERPFICEECGESFAQKDHLVMHSRFHGSTNSFACHECTASFTRKFELVNHSRLHGHVPLSCPICNKEFLQKRTLVVHMRSHTGEPSFHCHICSKEFYVRNDLVQHMVKHKSPDEAKLTCSECGAVFNNPEALALHVKLHSGDASLVTDLCTLTANLQTFPINKNKEPSLTKIKSHICKFCSRAFSAKHGLQQHNKRHPEGTCALKSHVCETCNKAFYQKNHLLLHQRQHGDATIHSPYFKENGTSPAKRIDEIQEQFLLHHDYSQLEDENVRLLPQIEEGVKLSPVVSQEEDKLKAPTFVKGVFYDTEDFSNHIEISKCEEEQETTFTIGEEIAA